MYLTNDVVKRIVKNNDYTRIRLATCGTKVFTKQEGGKKVGAHFRVLGEGLPVILPYTDPKSVLDADIPALKILLTDYYPLCTIFGGDFKTEIEKRGRRSASSPDTQFEMSAQHLETTSYVSLLENGMVPRMSHAQHPLRIPTHPDTTPPELRTTYFYPYGSQTFLCRL